MITPEEYGCKGDGRTDDTVAFQKAADACAQFSQTLYLKGKYKVRNINFTRGGKNFTITIKGDYQYCGVQCSMIIADGDYAFNIQNGKGCVIDGVFFTGSARIGLCVDYDAVAGTSGSTGTITRNCFFSGFDTGIEYSPNKKSLNNECNVIEYCVFTNLKTAFAGNQAQEKGNIIQHCKMWDNIETCFEWRGQPGQYTINNINIANVGSILNRFSGSYFPLFMSNIFAERITSFGKWMGGSGDRAQNMIINFRHPEDVIGCFPDYHIFGNNVLYDGCHFRYYGKKNIPVIIQGNNVHNCAGTTYVTPIKGLSPAYQDPGYTLEKIGRYSLTISDDRRAVVINSKPNTGDIIIFSAMGNAAYVGMSEVENNSGKAITLKHISNAVNSGSTMYDLWIYKPQSN